MRLVEDFHTHTYFSHGKGSIEDNVMVAREKGLERIAISDHGPGHLGFGIKRKDLPVMRAEIEKLNKKYNDIEILLAVEANVLGTDGTIDVTKADRSYYDIVQCGYHFGSQPQKLFRDSQIHLFNFLSKRFNFTKNRAKKLNTIAVVNAIKNNKIDVLTHPGAKGPIDILAVAKAAEEYGTYLEINNSHGHLTTEEIKICMQTDVKYIVGSDAHIPEDVGKFEDSYRRIKEAGLTLDRIVNLRED